MFGRGVLEFLERPRKDDNAFPGLAQRARKEEAVAVAPEPSEEAEPAPKPRAPRKKKDAEAVEAAANKKVPKVRGAKIL